MIDKLRQLLYDATIGLVDQYRQRSLELVKIHAATIYLNVIKAVRRHVMALFAMMFLVIVAAIAVVVLPAALVLAMPIASVWKVTAIVILALIDVLVPALFVSQLFSEKRWMELSKADELLKDAINN